MSYKRKLLSKISYHEGDIRLLPLMVLIVRAVYPDP